MAQDQLYPVNPNLVLSTDDTTVFVFKGAADDKEDWEWELMDKTNGGSSVRSDFEVQNNVENVGGLRIWLTVTFTARGLAAPSEYVKVPI